MTDIGKGVLTPAEIRGKIKEVSDDAVIAPAAVQAAATQMLAGDHSRQRGRIPASVGVDGPGMLGGRLVGQDIRKRPPPGR